MSPTGGPCRTEQSWADQEGSIPSTQKDIMQISRSEIRLVWCWQNGLRAESWEAWPAHLATQLGEDAWRLKPLGLMDLFPKATEMHVSISSNRWSRLLAEGGW